MNFCKLAIAIAPLFALTSHPASAYELATHAKITNAAYLQSNLGLQSSGLLRTLGILFSAREAMWRALTLKDQFGSRSIASGTSARALEAERLAYWATVFRALGDVAHLIQDMAQPQHTRNDMNQLNRPASFVSQLQRHQIELNAEVTGYAGRIRRNN